MAQVESPAAAGAGGPWPIVFADVLAAERRIRAHVPSSALRRYAPLESRLGGGIAIWVKHENHNPTGSFKVRNGLSAMARLSPEQSRRGVVAATRGNHGLGLAFAGALLGVEVTLCVPRGNNPEKNEGMRGYGARVLEEGGDYDEAAAVAKRLATERGLYLVHSTDNRDVIAGAATLTLEMLREQPDLDAMVVAVGGGSQAVGALTVARTLRPGLAVYGVQAAGASATHDSWHAGRPIAKPTADTFADGLATRNAYPTTFGALREGLAGFITVTDGEIAEAVRTLLATTHNLVEGAGAAGLAGLRALRDRLAGQRVGIILSGGNIDAATLERVLARAI